MSDNEQRIRSELRSVRAGFEDVQQRLAVLVNALPAEAAPDEEIDAFLHAERRAFRAGHAHGAHWDADEAYAAWVAKGRPADDGGDYPL